MVAIQNGQIDTPILVAGLEPMLIGSVEQQRIKNDCSILFVWHGHVGKPRRFQQVLFHIFRLGIVFSKTPVFWWFGFEDHQPARVWVQISLVWRDPNVHIDGRIVGVREDPGTFFDPSTIVIIAAIIIRQHVRFILVGPHKFQRMPLHHPWHGFVQVISNGQDELLVETVSDVGADITAGSFWRFGFVPKSRKQEQLPYFFQGFWRQEIVHDDNSWVRMIWVFSEPLSFQLCKVIRWIEKRYLELVAILFVRFEFSIHLRDK
mmetsp:Transcript_24252/g.35701  ORF Transcript_24252/g.35701 Transcript_24252/m.35701 type:complete len:262 (-) Transcript_24252:503-1288(-)